MAAAHKGNPTGTIRGTRLVRRQIEAADCPLDMLSDEHFLQRQFAADMEDLAATESAQPALARSVLRNLCRDLPLHHADEDESLFPRLRQRAAPEDEIGRLLDRLSADHRLVEGAIAPLIPALVCMAEGALPTTEDRAALCALAQAERRHLIFENAIVLPLARVRLTAADRQAMRDEMRARRLAPPVACAACIGPLQRFPGPKGCSE